MLDQPISCQLRARPLQALAVAAMVLGKSAQDAATILPRIFNLCRVAQGIAARAAFGVPQEDGWQEALRLEILKEHVLKLSLKWPGQLSAVPVALPRDWMTGGPALSEALFGPCGRMPGSFDGFLTFLEAPFGIAPVLRAIRLLFAPACAVRPALVMTSPSTIFHAKTQENSVAARHAEHPVMSAIEAQWGRGPLWSATAVAYDLQACMEDRVPTPFFADGLAIVPAARGLYGVKATVENNIVTGFHRITPTDQLLMRNGMLDHSLATLPAAQAEALAPLLLSILDPCFPITLEDAQRGEPAHA